MRGEWGGAFSPAGEWTGLKERVSELTLGKVTKNCLFRPGKVVKELALA
jgi:hypothetical protein